MIERDAGRALTMVAHAISLGSDPRTLTEALVGYLRNGFLSLMAPELVQLPSGRLDGLAEQAQRLGAAGLVRGIEVLGASLTEMRHAPDPRVLLDIATVQLTADSVATDTAALLGRIERLERQMAEGAVASAASPAVTHAAPVDPSTGRAALGGRARQPAPAAPAAGGTRPARLRPARLRPARLRPARLPRRWSLMPQRWLPRRHRRRRRRSPRTTGNSRSGRGCAGCRGDLCTGRVRGEHPDDADALGSERSPSGQV